MNKPANSNGSRFVGVQRKRILRKRGEAVYYDYMTGFFVWRKSWTEADFRCISTGPEIEGDTHA